MPPTPRPGEYAHDGVRDRSLERGGGKDERRLKGEERRRQRSREKRCGIVKEKDIRLEACAR